MPFAPTFHGLKIDRLRCAGEGDHVADIAHAGHELNHPFKSEAETGVGDGSVPPQIQIPPQFLGVDTRGFHAIFQDIQAFFPLGTADDFPHLRRQDIHRPDGFSVVVLAHIKRLDLGGVVGDDDGFFEQLLSQVALVLRLEI